MPVMTETRCRVGSVQARLSIQGVKGSLIHTPFFSAHGCNHRVYPEGCHARKNKNVEGGYFCGLEDLLCQSQVFNVISAWNTPVGIVL